METGTLFDTLSADTVSVIVKQLRSVVSRHNLKVTLMRRPDKSAMFDQVRFLALLFSENSPLRSAAAMLVSNISLSERDYNKTIDQDASSLSIRPELFEGEAREIELGRAIFSACGPYVRRISVNGSLDEEENEVQCAEQFLSYTFQYCRNVEDVVFCYNVPLAKWGAASLFFRQYAANLRSIHWFGKEEENGFPDLGKCVNLRCLRSSRLSPANLLTILQASGSKLEELRITIDPVRDSVQIIEAIRNYCVKLSVILIWDLKEVIDVVGQESYSSLIRGYGSQLKSASTYGLDHKHLVEVAKECTNLEVEESWTNEGSEKWGHTYHMGPRVVSLDMNADFLYGDEYIGALEQCSNLRALTMSSDCDEEILGVTDETIANVFSQSRFLKLEHLSVLGFRANTRNMGSIASSTKNLKSVYFDLFELDSEVNGFQLIADSNKQLKDIAIAMDVFREEEPSEEAALEWLSEVVKIFRKCRNLSVTVTCSNKGRVKKEDLIHTCKKLPCRGVDVDVAIGDVKYEYPEL